MSANYLALDIGEKRIGLAIGSVVPFGRGVIEVTSFEASLQAIAEICAQEGVTALVVGVPEVARDTESPSYQRVQHYLAALPTAVSLPIETVDEAFTSREAERQLRQEGVDTQHDKWRVDERSAELILEQFLQMPKGALDA